MVGELPVSVCGTTPIVIGAQPYVAFHKVAQAGSFAGQIDTTPARAATAVYRVGSFNDFDGLKVEYFTGLTPGVSHTVYINVVARGHATNEGAVSQWLATFAGTERNSRDISQNVFQRGGGTVLNDGLWNDLNGFWGVQERGGEFRL